MPLHTNTYFSFPIPTFLVRRSVCVYGGVSKRDQVTALRKGAQIVVATPGRLEDLIQDNACRWGGEKGVSRACMPGLAGPSLYSGGCRGTTHSLSLGAGNPALSSCRLDDVSYLVLDEADRMLDLGFEPHIRAIASKTRADRQVRLAVEGERRTASFELGGLGGVQFLLGPWC